MKLADLSWPEIDALGKETPVILPIAALEQHGRHMPLFTDSILMGEIANRAEAALGRRALFAPLQWLGNSHHHMDFPGTLSADPRIYMDLLSGLLENFIAHGLKRLLILNGHGGNDVPARQTVFEVRQRHRRRADLLLLSATYWHLAPDAQCVHPSLHQTMMGHACEWETSMLLRLAPHLVKDHQSVPPQEFGRGFAPAERGWIMGDRSQSGHIGMPHHATADKGEALLSVFSVRTVELIERMINWDGKSWDPPANTAFPNAPQH